MAVAGEPVTQALLEDGCLASDGSVIRLSPYLCRGSGEWVVSYANRLGAVLQGDFDDGEAPEGAPRSKVYGTWTAPPYPLAAPRNSANPEDINGCGGFPDAPPPT